MAQDLATIFIDKRPEAATNLKELLESHCSSSHFEIARSLREALEIIAEQAFDLCFISHEFTGDDLNAFVHDIGGLKRPKPMLLVQVREAIGAGETREELAGQRFATVITRSFTKEDQDSFSIILDILSTHRELAERSQESELLAELVLRELDRVSRDLKRGKERSLSRAPLAAVIREYAELSPQVMEHYLTFLEHRLSKSEPAVNKVPKVPQRLFERNFPGLANGTYEGQSLRVWDMLVRKYGVAADQEPVGAESKKPSSTKSEP